MNDKYLDAHYQRCVSDFVSQEVRHSANGLVRTLANGYGTTKGELSELCEKAFELSCPVDDYEEPVFEHVRNLDRESVTAYLENWGFACSDDEPIEDLRTAMISQIAETSNQDYCEHNNLEPHQVEIYEHWIVSKYLAERLAEKGEKVDMDFEGLIIWGRPTSGQAISIDYVICKIYDEMMEA